MAKLDTTARWAGYFGLVPFAVAGVLASLGGSGGALGLGADAAMALAEQWALAWGAIILTFIAAVHWGLALAGAWPWSLSGVLGAILPSLLGLTGLLVGGVRGIAILIVGFGFFWLYEHRWCAQRLPADYLQLRRVLTLWVCALLVLTAMLLDSASSS